MDALQDNYVGEEARNCSICGGELLYFGTLGEVEYWKCRDCGMPVSVNEE